MCDCQRALDLLSARLDGTLTLDETRELESHLNTCSECNGLASDLDSLHSILPTLLEEVPEGFQQRVMARIAAEQVPCSTKTPHHIWRTMIAVAAVFAVVIMGARMDFSGRSSDSSVPLPAADALPEAGIAPEGAVSIPEVYTQRNTEGTDDTAKIGPQPRLAVTNVAEPPTVESAGRTLVEFEYPNAVVTPFYDGADLTGFTVTQVTGERLQIDCLGLSDNGQYYEFSLGAQDEVIRFAVSLDGLDICSDREDAEAYDDAVEH